MNSTKKAVVIIAIAAIVITFSAIAVYLGQQEVESKQDEATVKILRTKTQQEYDLQTFYHIYDRLHQHEIKQGFVNLSGSSGILRSYDGVERAIVVNATKLQIEKGLDVRHNISDYYKAQNMFAPIFSLYMAGLHEERIAKYMTYGLTEAQASAFDLNYSFNNEKYYFVNATNGENCLIYHYYIKYNYGDPQKYSLANMTTVDTDEKVMCDSPPYYKETRIGNVATVQFVQQRFAEGMDKVSQVEKEGYDVVGILQLEGLTWDEQKTILVSVILEKQ